MTNQQNHPAQKHPADKSQPHDSARDPQGQERGREQERAGGKFNDPTGMDPTRRRESGDSAERQPERAGHK